MTPSYIFEPTSGILSTNDAPDLLYWVSSSLDSGANFLLVDLAQITRIDSSGLGTLMIACNRVRRAGGTLALCSLNSQTQMQIERAGLLEKFDIYTDRREFESFISGDDDLNRYAF
ncbi:MAG: STAS domain-containing protein [Merismopedia sp. SIO2A8]|nr:STAS domain-containing protein [Symploca sp. SIO2B6]NET48828.1 STAS domain-containing protein [Merismopedia sp. SIO2A8]